jgi:hypothetical protein
MTKSGTREEFFLKILHLDVNNDYAFIWSIQEQKMHRRKVFSKMFCRLQFSLKSLAIEITFVVNRKIATLRKKMIICLFIKD